MNSEFKIFEATPQPPTPRRHKEGGSLTNDTKTPERASAEKKESQTRLSGEGV